MNENMKLEPHNNADRAGDIDDRRSTLDYCVFSRENLIAWRSRKQDVVTRSRSMTHGV